MIMKDKDFARLVNCGWPQDLSFEDEHVIHLLYFNPVLDESPVYDFDGIGLPPSCLND